MAGKSAHLLVFSVIFLVIVGIVMLSSTSVFSVEHPGDPYFDVKRQLMWLGLSVPVCAGLACLDYHWLRRGAVVWYVAVVILLVLCFIPMVGEEVKGASRWISGKSFGLGFLRFQPSEAAKLGAIIGVSAWYARHEDESDTFVRGFVQPLLIVGFLVVLIGAEVDLGAAALVSVVAFAIMFVAGAGFTYVGGVALAGLAALGGAIALMPDRLERVKAFMDLEGNSQGKGYQQMQGLLAFGSGGVGGLGLGNGRQKLQYLPEAHTDFIFPMVGEELGLVFTLSVVGAFVAILVAGGMIALHAPDRFGKLLAFGIVTMITVQAVINIGVTTAVLPNKGMPLPFVSYGGSNLLFCFVGVGILLNIYRQGLHYRDDRFPKILRAKITPRL